MKWWVGEPEQREQKEEVEGSPLRGRVEANTVCAGYWLKVSKPPGAGMSEGWSLLLLKLVAGILKETGGLCEATY